MLLLQPYWIAIFLSLSSVSYASPVKRICEAGLESQPQISLRQRIRNTVIAGHPSGGFEVRAISSSNDNAATREVEFQSLLYDSGRWRNEEWIYNGAHYSFLEVGFKNLERDSQEMHQLVLEHLRSHPGDTLRVVFGRRRNEDLGRLMQLRWATHDAVLEVYKQSKSYLGWADFSILKYVNRLSGNSDVLSLLRYDPNHEAWSALSGTDVHERLVSTAQVSYHGNPVVMVPTERSLLIAGDPGGADQLPRKFPFEFRVDIEQSRQVHENLTAIFDPATTCEITRFINRFARLPRPIMHRLLFEVFDTILKRNMKVAIASLDSQTFRVFRREYGFSKLFDFPVKGNKEMETLAFLTTDSQAFAETYRKLHESGMRVETRRINEQ